jgi:hypothetical protein
MNNVPFESEVADLRTALEKALVRGDAVNHATAWFLFLKRLTDIAHSPEQVASFISTRHPSLLRKIASVSWNQVEKAEDPAAAIRDVLETVEEGVESLRGLSRFNTLVYSLNAAVRAEVSLEPVFSALNAISLETVSDMEMVAIVERTLDAPSWHAVNATTPATVRLLVSRLVSNESFDSAYDPAIGTAVLVAEICDAARQRGASPELFGQELATDLVNLAKIRAFLGGYQFDFRDGDTLLNPEFAKERRRFDLVVAHPPFGKIVGAKVPRLNRSDLTMATTYEAAFLQHVVSSMSDRGRGVVIVPTGLLTRATDRDLRQKLVQGGTLDAVINLPPFLFTGTDIAASILILKGPQRVDSHDVVFVDLSASIEGQKTRPTLTEVGMAAAISAVIDRVPTPGVSAVSTKQAISELDYDLSVSRHVRRVEPEGASLAECARLYSEAVARRNETEGRALGLLASLSVQHNQRGRDSTK